MYKRRKKKKRRGSPKRFYKIHSLAAQQGTFFTISFRKLARFWELEVLKFQVLFLPSSSLRYCLSKPWPLTAPVLPGVPGLGISAAPPVPTAEPEACWKCPTALSAHTSSNNWFLPLPVEEQHPLRWEEMHPEECKNSSELFTQEITPVALWKVPVSWTVSLEWASCGWPRGWFTVELNTTCGSLRISWKIVNSLFCPSLPIWFWVIWCCIHGKASWLCPSI